MIKKLQKKFILINMLCIMAVLLVVFCGLYWSNYHKYVREKEMQMRQALDDVHFFTPPSVEWEEIRNKGRDAFDDIQKRPKPPRTMMSLFAVDLDKAGAVTDIESWNITVEEELAGELAALVVQNKAERGSLKGYSLSYLRKETSDGTRIVFADLYYASNSMRGLLINYMILFLAAAGAFYLLSLFLSKWALKPAQRAWQQQNQFIADASHELKTPLTVILANLDILLSHRQDSIESQLKWVDNTKSEAASMKQLVEDLLFLARFEAGAAPAVLGDVDLGDAVLNSVLPFEPIAFEKGIQLETQIEPDIHVLGNRGQLKQLSAILTDNACKYAAKDGTVRVSVSLTQGGKPCLKVENTGAPIGREELPHIFERFYREDKARTKSAGGYGLGLSIAKAIVENHGGKITVTSAPGEMTAFAVVFPEASEAGERKANRKKRG